MSNAANMTVHCKVGNTLQKQLIAIVIRKIRMRVFFSKFCRIIVT